MTQWNCRGFLANYDDSLLLINDIQPSCICLQETMLHHNILRPPSGYNDFCDSPEDAVLGQGMITLVQWDAPAYGITLTTNLQALAVRVELG